MGFFSALGNIFSAIGRGIMYVVRGLFSGIAKIFTREYTVIDSDTYRPITNKQKIFNDSRGRTPLDMPPTPAMSRAGYESVPPYEYSYGYVSTPEHIQIQQSADFLRNLYRINPDVIDNPRYIDYDVNSDPYHGYGTVFGPMFNPELSNRRYDMFGRPYDDIPLYDSSIRYNNHPPMANLNPFSPIEQTTFSKYPLNYSGFDYIPQQYDNSISDMGRAYQEHLSEQERNMWSDDYIEDLDKYIWEEDHGYSRLTTPELDNDVERRRIELSNGETSTYVPDNYVGNAR